MKSNKEQLWNDLFSPEILECMKQYYKNQNQPGESPDTSRISRKAMAQWNHLFQKDVRDEKIKAAYFTPFYQRLYAFADTCLRSRLEEEGEGEAAYQIIRESLFPVLGEKYGSICGRVLISDMHQKKEEGRLKGNTREEEYEYYEKQYLDDFGGWQDIFSQYPGLLGSIAEITANMTDSYVQAWKCYEKDREELSRRAGCPLGDIRKIQGGQSDLHRGGKSVLTFVLENGVRLIYKPRSLKNEACFMEFLNWISDGSGIEQKSYWLLDRDSYGWEEFVEYEECADAGEVREFYRRLGVILFAAYLFSMGDIHQENLIASGAYPVVIDVETLLTNKNLPHITGAYERAAWEAEDSVLTAGILPFYVWNDQGKGISVSAIGGAEEQVSWVKMPVMADIGTSDMHIEYQYVAVHRKQNHPGQKGKETKAGDYEKEVSDGFERAYRFLLEHMEEAREKCSKMQQTWSRILLRHTQQYLMYLLSSYHPVFMRDREDRKMAFGKLFQAAVEGRYPAEAVGKEAESLVRGDIPVFYCIGNDTWLCDENRQKIGKYFENTAYEVLQRKLNKLCTADMERQKDLIHLSMSLFRENDRGKKGPELPEAENIGQEEKVCGGDIEKAVIRIYDELEKTAITNPEGTEVNWLSLRIGINREHTWAIEPVDMYLYDGIAGIALFVLACESGGYVGEKRKLGKTVSRTLFSYTDAVLENPENLQSRNTGAFYGEGSVVYAYISLFDITGEKIYLDYAEKHSRVLDGLLEEDTSYDVLSGNAGAILVLLDLCEKTGKETYLGMAERAALQMLKYRTKGEGQAGWVIPGQHQVLAGLSHGASGCALAFARLGRAAHREEYLRLAEEIWAYEDTLYDESIGNWKDLRGMEGQEIFEDTVAWCNGAAGILLARSQLTEPDGLPFCTRSVQNAAEKTESSMGRTGWCLCHGKLGNGWILYACRRTDRLDTLLSACARRLLEDEGIETKERCSKGFMSGVTGMGYVMMAVKGERKLPMILDVR